jgi:hypothetical protein
MALFRLGAPIVQITMTRFRLYESAWVVVDGGDKPAQVRKHPGKPGYFQVGEFTYDIDACTVDAGAPRLLSVLNLEAAREARLHSDYGTRPGDGPGLASSRRGWFYRV